MKKRILCIEDNRDISIALEKILSNRGYDVEICHNGKDGIEKARKNDYHMLLVEIQLKDMNGFKIFEELKNKIRSKFIFLSIYPLDSIFMSKYKFEGLTDYVEAPFSKENLLNKVIGILDKY